MSNKEPVTYSILNKEAGISNQLHIANNQVPIQDSSSGPRMRGHAATYTHSGQR